MIQHFSASLHHHMSIKLPVNWKSLKTWKSSKCSLIPFSCFLFIYSCELLHFLCTCNILVWSWGVANNTYLYKCPTEAWRAAKWDGFHQTKVIHFGSANFSDYHACATWFCSTFTLEKQQATKSIMLKWVSMHTKIFCFGERCDGRHGVVCKWELLKM